MNKQHYDTIAWITYLSFTGTLPIVIMVAPSHLSSQPGMSNFTIALALFCLVSLVIWGILAYDLLGWKDRLPSAPIKYRLRIESTNMESQYILESRKPNSSYWRKEGSYRDLETALARQQELDNQEIKQVQIIQL